MSEIRCRDSGLGPMPFCEKLELTKNWIIGFAGTSPGAPGDTVSWDHMSSFVGWSLVMCSLHPHTHTRARARPAKQGSFWKKVRANRRSLSKHRPRPRMTPWSNCTSPLPSPTSTRQSHSLTQFSASRTILPLVHHLPKHFSQPPTSYLRRKNKLPHRCLLWLSPNNWLVEVQEAANDPLRVHCAMALWNCQPRTPKNSEPLRRFIDTMLSRLIFFLPSRPGKCNQA